MSHLAAEELSSQLVAVVIGLFTLACLVINKNFYALNIDLDHLCLYMLERKLSSAYDLAWFGMNSVWVPKALTAFQVLLGLGGYFGSIFFFFYSRKKSAVARQYHGPLESVGDRVWPLAAICYRQVEGF